MRTGIYLKLSGIEEEERVFVVEEVERKGLVLVLGWWVFGFVCG